MAFDTIPAPPALVDRVREICEAETTTAYTAEGHPEIHGAIIAYPRQVQHVQELLHLAENFSATLVPRGMGSSRSGGTTPLIDNDRIPIVVDLTSNADIDIDVVGKTAWVGSGATNTRIRNAAFSQGLCYPVDIVSGFSTIGGNVATDAIGLSGFRFGSTRQYVQDLHVVLATGSRIMTGTKQTQLSGSGLNWNHLFCGSEGTLGIIWNVRLRLLSQQNRPRTYLASFDSSSTCIAAGQRLLRRDTDLWSIDYLDSNTTYLTGNELITDHAGRHVLIVRSTSDLEDMQLLNQREAELVAHAYASILYQTDLVCLVGCSPLDTEQMLFRANEIATSNGGNVCVYGSLGLGRYTVRFLGCRDIDACVNALYDHVLLLDGSFALEGIGHKHAQRFVRYRTELARCTLAIKQAMDPRLLLNPLKVL